MDRQWDLLCAQHFVHIFTLQTQDVLWRPPHCTASLSHTASSVKWDGWHSHHPESWELTQETHCFDPSIE